MFHASGAVNFRADAQENGATGQKEPRLLRLVEEYKNFRRVPDEEVQELLIKHRPAVVARAKLAAASVAAIASETEGASTSAASSDSAASVEAKSSDASSDPSTSVDAAPVTPFVDDADKPLTLDEYNPASPPQLWRGVYIFEQYSVDEQVELDAETGKPLGTRHVPAEEPFMHVAYHVILKMTKSDVQSSALGSIE
jgi:hypothetical protein